MNAPTQMQPQLAVPIPPPLPAVAPPLQPLINQPPYSPPAHKISLHLSEVLRVKEVAQAIVIMEPSAGLAAAASFDMQASQIEGHFVLDDRSWSAALAKTFAPRGQYASAGLALNVSRSTKKARQQAQPVKSCRYSSLGVVLGNVHADGLEALSKDPNVRYVGSSIGLHLINPTRVAAAAAPSGTTWGIAMLEADRLWSNGLTGAGVRVGHIDTGVDASHPALKDAVKGFLLTDEQGFPVANARPKDTGIHGTHTAGTIAGRAVSGRHIGVAPGAELWSADVIDGCNVVARILAGLDWALKSGVQIVSLSLGLPGYHDDFYEVMRAIKNRGVLPVVAVGNEGPGTSRSPGNYDLVLSVGACDTTRNVPPFSSSDTFSQPVVRRVPDVVAPGVDVISAKVGGGFMQMDGSSMATPHLAGLAALLWQAKRDATLAQIEQAIYESCAPSPSGTERGGRGIPNAPRALAALTGQKLPNVGARSRAVGGVARRGRTVKKQPKKPQRAGKAAKRSAKRSGKSR